MKTFVKDYFEFLLGGLAILIGGVLIWMIVSNSLVIAKNMGKAFGSAEEAAPAMKFDIEKAKTLNFRGRGE